MTAYNRSVVMIIAGGFCLSTLGITTRLMESADGLQIVFYRAIGLAIFSTALILFSNRGNIIQPFQSTGWPGLIAGVFFSLASLTIVLAMVNTTVANAMFIVSLTPLLAGLFAWAFLGEKVKPKTWVAILVAVFGVLIIVNAAISTQGLLGIGYAFLMAICYALFTVTLRSGKDLDMLPAMCWSAYMTIIVLCLNLDNLTIPTSDLMLCLALGLFQTGLGGYLLIVGSKHVPAAQLTLLAMLEVVFNPIWVWLGVGETPSSATLIGGGVIMLAIAYEAISSGIKRSHV